MPKEQLVQYGLATSQCFSRADNDDQELTTSLSTFPMDVAAVLVGKEFIQKEVLLKVLGEHIPREKAAILVKTLRNKIETAPKKFSEFLAILSELPSTGEIVECLRSTYQRGEFYSDLCPYKSILCAID